MGRNDFFFFEDELANLFDLGLNRGGRFEKSVCSNSFPPSNMYITSLKDLVIEVALAGVNPNDVSVELVQNTISLKVKSKDSVKEDNKSYIQRGLKFAMDNEVMWKIDVNKFDVDNITVDLKNGLLTIKVPPRNKVIQNNSRVLFGNVSTNDNKSVETHSSCCDSTRVEKSERPKRRFI